MAKLPKIPKKGVSPAFRKAIKNRTGKDIGEVIMSKETTKGINSTRDQLLKTSQETIPIKEFIDSTLIGNPSSKGANRVMDSEATLNKVFKSPESIAQQDKIAKEHGLKDIKVESAQNERLKKNRQRQSQKNQSTQDVLVMPQNVEKTNKAWEQAVAEGYDPSTSGFEERVKNIIHENVDRTRVDIPETQAGKAAGSITRTGDVSKPEGMDDATWEAIKANAEFKQKKAIKAQANARTGKEGNASATNTDKKGISNNFVYKMAGAGVTGGLVLSMCRNRGQQNNNQLYGQY